MKRGLCIAALTFVTAVSFYGQAILAVTAEAVASTSRQRDRFTNDDVVTMVRAGFSKDTIIAAVRSHGPEFDTSLDGLMMLRDEGVDEDIIREILSAAMAATERAPDVTRPDDAAETDDGLPAANGIYARVDGRYVLLAVEPIEWRSAFFAGRTTVGSLTTSRLNARLPGIHSPFVVPTIPDLFLVCDECETGLEYHLVRSHDEEDKREFHVSFQILTGRNETWILQGGQKGARVPFLADRLGAGQFKLNLPPLAPDDYGFLPPSRGGNPQSLATSVMYTFFFQPGSGYRPRLTTRGRALGPSADLIGDQAAPAALELTATLLATHNDVEEKKNGELDFDDGDIDLGEIAVGLRFPAVSIPRGATIVSAHLRFTAEANDDEETTILIRAESAANAAPFRDEDADLTSRTFTKASASWSPPAWKKDEAGPAQRTPDLADVLQEVVSRPDWRQGNAVMFMLDGVGQRDARTYDDDRPARGARLEVTYSPASPPTER